MNACIHSVSWFYKEVRPVLVVVLYWFGGVAGILVCFGWVGLVWFLEAGGAWGFFGWDFFSGFGGVV